MTAHFSRHFAFRHAGQHPFHERMARSSHDWTSARFEDGLLHAHGALHVVHDSKVLVVCGVIGQVELIHEQIFSEESDEAVRVDEPADFVHGANAVAVPVGTNAEFATVFNHRRSEINHVLWSSWIGPVVRFAGIPIAVKVNVFAT